MKQESLVIADQNAAVNTFPGLVHTARHTMGVDCTRSGQLNLRGSVHHGVVDDWGEVVTRQPQGNLRLDHLLIDGIRSARIHNKLFFSLSLRLYKRNLGLQLSWLEHRVDNAGVSGSSPLRPTIYIWGHSSVGRAPALHAGGQRFDSVWLHHYKRSKL